MTPDPSIRHDLGTIDPTLYQILVSWSSHRFLALPHKLLLLSLVSVFLYVGEKAHLVRKIRVEKPWQKVQF